MPDHGFGVCRIPDLEVLIQAKHAPGRERDRQAVVQFGGADKKTCSRGVLPGIFYSESCS